MSFNWKSYIILGATVGIACLWLFCSKDAIAQQADSTGSIKGVVKFEGDIPQRDFVITSVDKVCAKVSDEVLGDTAVVGDNGELAHVILHLDGVRGTFPSPETPVQLDQKDCMYQPHVLALLKGQRLEVRNRDKTLHNVHVYRGATTKLNRAVFKGVKPIVQVYEEEGIVKFTCDIHPWMTAYAYVATNPFFATTGEDGSFEIKGIPPGDYTLRAWHEKYGEKSLQVTVRAGTELEGNFTFTP